MKIIKFGTAGKMVCIGDDPKRGTWYRISDSVRPFLVKMQEGDDVSIRSENQNGTETLVHINKGGNGSTTTASAPVNRVTGAQSSNTGASAKVFPQPDVEKKTYGKSQAEQDNIKRQALGNMASRSLIALQGFVTPENIEDITRRQYALFQELVG